MKSTEKEHIFTVRPSKQACIYDEMGQCNYSHVVPNSHFFTDIAHLLETLKYPRTNEIKTEQQFIDHLRIGLENTLKQDYNLHKVVSTEKLIDQFLRDPEIHKMD